MMFALNLTLWEATLQIAWRDQFHINCLSHIQKLCSAKLLQVATFT